MLLIATGNAGAALVKSLAAEVELGIDLIAKAEGIAPLAFDFAESVFLPFGFDDQVLDQRDGTHIFLQQHLRFDLNNIIAVAGCQISSWRAGAIERFHETQ